MERHDVLAQLEVVRELVGAGEVRQKVNDVLLLASEVGGELLAALLELLLRGELDHLLAFLGDILCRRFALAGDRLALRLARHGGWGRLSCGAIELVHALHVVEEVVTSGEAVARNSTLTVCEVAKVRPGTMAMHAVRLTLVTEQASSGGKLDADASLLVAAEGLEMGIDILVVVALK